jgi:hypothetical protein
LQGVFSLSFLVGLRLKILISFLYLKPSSTRDAGDDNGNGDGSYKAKESTDVV